MKRLAAVVASFMLIAVGVEVGATSSPATAASRQAAIDWGRCADPFLRQSGARCAMLDVPLDYDDPSGTQIQIALSRVVHTVPEAEYQGVMLGNPGGPGGSGLWISTLGQYVPDGAGAAYDWIGFDPRGVGSSEPSLSCLPNYFHGDRPPYVPKRESLETKWLARSERYADACAANAPELLPHMTTIDAARDMDSIRQALGVEQINYFGFSYGTYLGQVYATLFPGTMRRAVFDASVDPRNVWYEGNLLQDVGFERNIHIWFQWLAEYRDVYRLGRSEEAVERRFYDAQNALKRDPAGGVVGPDEWADVFLYAGYAQGSGPTWVTSSRAGSTATR
ncbi:MAG TPA: alpha/beta fold hydrolase [Actinomycetota bacterium]|nr:alpha/beta fold hydrolase [Actinomycetota bacterium]